MNIKEKLKALLIKTLPFMREIFEEKIIPNAIKKGYEVFDKFADEKIEALAEQVEKYENTLDADKKAKYKRGIALGADMLTAIALKLSSAADAFLEAIK